MIPWLAPWTGPEAMISATARLFAPPDTQSQHISAHTKHTIRLVHVC